MQMTFGDMQLSISMLNQHKCRSHLRLPVCRVYRSVIRLLCLSSVIRRPKGVDRYLHVGLTVRSFQPRKSLGMRVPKAVNFVDFGIEMNAPETQEQKDKISTTKKKPSLNPTRSIIVIRVPHNGAKFSLLKLTFKHLSQIRGLVQ